jgi:nicotinamidase-related amidase
MSRSVPPDRPLLLIIDMQPAFLSAVADGARILRRCGFAAEVARGLGLPAVFTEQVPAKLGPTAPELLALADKPAVFAKDEFSALANGAIRTAVQASGATRLLLGGIETPVCVFQTARDALAAGLQATLLTDCVGARRSDDAAAAQRHLARLGVELLPAETVFYALLHSARHPFFRAYTQLVKKYA